MSKGIAAIVVACLMALAGCGSSGSASTTTAVPATTAAPSSTAATTTTLNVKAVGQKVLAIINSGNAAIDRDKKISGQSTEFKAVSGDFSSAAQQLHSQQAGLRRLASGHCFGDKPELVADGHRDRRGHRSRRLRLTAPRPRAPPSVCLIADDCRTRKRSTRRSSPRGDYWRKGRRAERRCVRPPGAVAGSEWGKGLTIRNRHPRRRHRSPLGRSCRREAEELTHPPAGRAPAPTWGPRRRSSAPPHLALHDGASHSRDRIHVGGELSVTIGRAGRGERACRRGTLERRPERCVDD